MAQQSRTGVRVMPPLSQSMPCDKAQPPSHVTQHSTGWGEPVGGTGELQKVNDNSPFLEHSA